MSEALEPSNVTADDALSSLVSQFSSALDCFRELVQNSIDAGSPRVDVWLTYQPSESGAGTIEIHVDDFGEGMDQRIIENQLTKLFSSNKEDDLTKISKFGIGFVSIFALNPKAVLLHTGRGGEYWEVMFHEDRSYSMMALDVPTEGTQLTLFLEGDYHRYLELVAGSKRALKKWCGHSETEITFEDRSDDRGPEIVNEPFAVEGDCLATASHQGTEIVLAYNRSPGYGFYNKGLTLLFTRDAEEGLDEHASRFGHIAFKIKSRYLEHTLSRETVLRDNNYLKAIELIQEAAAGPLLNRLVDQLEALAAQPI